MATDKFGGILEEGDEFGGVLVEDQPQPQPFSFNDQPVQQVNQFGLPFFGPSASEMSETDIALLPQSEPSFLEEIKGIPSGLGGLLGYAGNISRAIPADLAAGFRGDPSVSGNIPAAFTEEPLPIDEALNEAAREEAFRGRDEFGRPGGAAVLGKISQGLAGSAPLLAAGGLPSLAQRLLIGGFTGKMAVDTGRVATELGTELGKPEAERDPAKLSDLYSEAIQLGAFTPLGGAFALRPGAPRPTRLPPDVEAAAAFGGAPVREPGLRFNENPLDPPWVRPLVEQGLREAQTGIRIPGEPTAIELLQAQQRQIQPVESLARPEQFGGQISFDAPAGAGVIPSARQSANPFFDRPGEMGGFGESLPPTIEQIRAQRALEERIQNATGKGPQPQGGQPQRPETAPGGLPAEAVSRNRPEQSGDVTQTPQKIAEDFGVRFDGEQMGRWMWTAFDSAGKPSTTFVTKAGASPGEVAGKYNQIRDAYEGAPNGPRQLQATKPEPPQPDWQVSVQASSGEIPGNVQIVDPRATEASVSPTVQSLREAGFHVPDFSKLPQGKYTYGEAVQKATQLEAHGGGESTLTHEQRAMSRRNNSREAFMKLQAEADAARLAKQGPALEQPRPFKSEPAPSQIEAAPSEPVIEGVTALDPQSGAPLSATESLINRVELPNSLVDWANLTIQRSKSLGAQPVGGPELLTAYAIKGAELIGKGISTFKEWSKEMVDTYGEGIKAQLDEIWKQSKNTVLEVSKPGPEGAGPESSRRALPSASGSVTVPPSEVPAGPAVARGDALEMRKLSERGTRSPEVPQPVRKQIAQSPESFYRKQGLSGVSDEVRAMSDAELAALDETSPNFTAGKLDLANRLFDAGKNEAGYRVFQDLSKTLTRLGQVINQAKLLNALRPERVAEVINRQLAEAGRDPLTPEQTGRLEQLSRDRIEGQRNLDKATDEWLENPSDANAAKAEQVLINANRTSLAEQRMIHNFQHRSTGALLKSILQGNLLTPISQVANLVGNVSFLPFRAAMRTAAAPLDALDAFIRNRPRQISVAPIEGTKAAAGGLARGIKEIPNILWRGTSDVVKGEKRASMHPLRAWAKQFSSNPDAPTIGGKIPFSERVNLAIEGTFGVPAEIMLRGLGAGDIAFREAARARLISEQSRLQGVPEGQKRMAQNFPELFFDKETLARIEQETRGAVFQQSSKGLGHLMSWLKGKGDGFDLAVATIAPYKLTPWNIVGEILSYNPLIAMGRTALEAKRGNVRAAEMNAAKVVVGGTLTAAGVWLYQNGLISPSLDSSDVLQKERILAGEVMPPNSINISGLKRALTGGDPSFQAGDTTVDYFRAGGLAGSMFYMVANVGRDIETNPEADNVLMSVLKNSTLEQARFGLNQSFLRGVSGVLDAVKDGNADTFLQSYANTITSIPLPNTLTAISRANREYKPELKGQNLGEQFANVFKNRVGDTADLPLKRGLWGEPLRETPKDRNALVYHFFDITKGKQVTDDPVPLELYRLYRKTANTSIIPSPPEKTFTFARTTYLLTPEQRSRLAELVGTQRRQIVDKLFINPKWHELPDEMKIKMLKRVYDRGLDIGKAKFWMETGVGQLEQKPERAGFNQ